MLQTLATMLAIPGDPAGCRLLQASMTSNRPVSDLSADYGFYLEHEGTLNLDLCMLL